MKDSGTNSNIVIGGFGAASGAKWFHLRFGSSQLQIDTQGSATAGNAPNLAKDVWYFVCGYHKTNGEIKGYVSSVSDSAMTEKTSGTRTLNIDNGKIVIGDYVYPENGWQGYIDACLVYFSFSFVA